MLLLLTNLSEWSSTITIYNIFSAFFSCNNYTTIQYHRLASWFSLWLWRLLKPPLSSCSDFGISLTKKQTKNLKVVVQNHSHSNKRVEYDACALFCRFWHMKIPVTRHENYAWSVRNRIFKNKFKKQFYHRFRSL